MIWVETALKSTWKRPWRERQRRQLTRIHQPRSWKRTKWSPCSHHSLNIEDSITTIIKSRVFRINTTQTNISFIFITTVTTIFGGGGGEVRSIKINMRKLSCDYDYAMKKHYNVFFSFFLSLFLSYTNKPLLPTHTDAVQKKIINFKK